LLLIFLIFVFIYLHIYVYSLFYYYWLYLSFSVSINSAYYFYISVFCNGTTIEPLFLWKRRPVFGIISQYKVKLPWIPLNLLSKAVTKYSDSTFFPLIWASCLLVIISSQTTTWLKLFNYIKQNIIINNLFWFILLNIY